MFAKSEDPFTNTETLRQRAEIEHALEQIDREMSTLYREREELNRHMGAIDEKMEALHRERARLYMYLEALDRQPLSPR
jgi:chromosome segregation ATPase